MVFHFLSIVLLSLVQSLTRTLFSPSLSIPLQSLFLLGILLRILPFLLRPLIGNLALSHTQPHLSSPLLPPPHVHLVTLDPLLLSAGLLLHLPQGLAGSDYLFMLLQQAGVGRGRGRGSVVDGSRRESGGRLDVPVVAKVEVGVLGGSARPDRSEVLLELAAHQPLEVLLAPVLARVNGAGVGLGELLVFQLASVEQEVGIEFPKVLLFDLHLRRLSLVSSFDDVSDDQRSDVFRRELFLHDKGVQLLYQFRWIDGVIELKEVSFGVCRERLDEGPLLHGSAQLLLAEFVYSHHHSVVVLEQRVVKPVF